MTTRTKTALLACGAALGAFLADRASCDLIELTNGQVLQGDINDGQTNDDGLGVNVYDTGGTVVLRWDHIIESRRKELRIQLGIDLPEETTVLVWGHRVLLVSGEVVSGVSPNPRAEHEPLKMKTRSGTKEYDRSSLAGKVEDVQLDGLLVYTPEELYLIERDKNPPEMAAAHKKLAQTCINIGAFDHAKEHLAACRADAGFMGTPEGKSVEGMDRLCDVMIRAKGASDLKGQITIAQHEQRWNDALKLLNTLASDANYKDESIRKAIGFELLEARVVKGRDTFFQKEIARDVYKVMDGFIDAKAREKKPRLDPGAAGDPPKAGSALPGTLAAARQWENRELYKLLWEKVVQDLGLTGDEAEKYWKARSVKNVRRAAYLTGSFIVVKKAAPPGQKPKDDKPRRAPPSDRGRGGKNIPEKPSKVEKPMTDEEWWEQVGPSDRASWLRANFVEQMAGMFEILRADQNNCADCGGTGVKTTQTTGGDEEQHFCKTCNGCGVFRVVNYR